MLVNNLYLLWKIRHYYYHNDFNASLIINNIYLGNIYDAYDTKALDLKLIMF